MSLLMCLHLVLVSVLALVRCTPHRCGMPGGICEPIIVQQQKPEVRVELNTEQPQQQQQQEKQQQQHVQQQQIQHQQLQQKSRKWEPLLHFAFHTNNDYNFTKQKCFEKCYCSRGKISGPANSMLGRGLIVSCKKAGYAEVPANMPIDTIALDLDENYNITTIKARAFENLTCLVALSIQSNRIVTIEEDAFANLNKLQVLSLYYNAIDTFSDYVFSPLLSLRWLDLADNWIRKLNPCAFVNVTRLLHLDLSVNSLNEFPVFHARQCNGEYIDSVVAPNLTHLSLDNNNIVKIPTVQDVAILGLHNLKYLNICCNRLHNLYNENFKLFPNLIGLKLHRNKLKRIYPHVFNSSAKSLVNINMRYSFHLISNIFHYLPNLEVLLLTGNYVDQNDTSMFQNFSRLKLLDIERTFISIHPNMLLGTTAIESLIMNDLDIHVINSDFFKPLEKLRRLSLSKNNIATVNFSSFPAWLWNNLSYLSLDHNPFHCDCGLVFFRDWLHTTNTSIRNFRIPNAYRCTSPEPFVNMDVMKLQHPTKLECLTRPPDMYFISVFLFDMAFMLLAFIGSVLHLYRWDFRYWSFLYKKNRREYIALADQRRFKYDAFVCYSELELPWVRTYLIPNLEGDHLPPSDKFHLCLHHRDWLVGQDIAENVVESIESSRKTVLILSNAFTESHWCHFELTMAQTRMFRENHDNLVLVLVEEISPENISARLRHQMERQTYIEWTQDSVRGQQLFWARLRQALQKPHAKVMQSPMALTDVC